MLRLALSGIIFIATVSGEFLVVSQNGPSTFGATVTVRAVLYNDTTHERITSPCKYGFVFSDDNDPPNVFMDFSKLCSSEWSIAYWPSGNEGHSYNVEAVAYVMRGTRFWPLVKANTVIQMTPFLNGEIEIVQNAVIPYNNPVFTHTPISARIQLSPADDLLLAKLGASFKTDWSFDVEATTENPGKNSDRLWNLAKNAHPGASIGVTFTSFHGCYVNVRARLCSVVKNNTHTLGNTYGFFYRRFLLMDPVRASGLANFTAEVDTKSGHIVVNGGRVDAVIVEE